MSRSVFRVTYGSGPDTSFIVAESGPAAVAFLGIPVDMPAQVYEVAKNVEVVGIDPAHAPLVSPAPSKADFDLPKGVSQSEFQALQAQVAELAKKIPGTNPGAAGTTPAK